MLSYVVPNQEKGSGQIVSPQRNLSLNLSPQYAATSTAPPTTTTTLSINCDMTSQASHIIEDAMLSNVGNDALIAADERTRLISAGTPPPTRSRRSTQQQQHNSNQNYNNNNYNKNNSFNNSSIITTTANQINPNNKPTMNNIAGGEGGISSCNSGAGGAADSVTALEDDDTNTTATGGDSDASDKQQHQHQQQQQQTTKKPKLSKLGSKSVGLKRVSFGSSKGSMVETLVFETPTPLSEHVEPSFGFDTSVNYKTPTNNHGYSRVNMDDSGIELQEESERSIVRVSIYQSSEPQHINPPEYLTRLEDSLDNSFSNYNNLEDIMAAAAATSTIPGYDRQQSTDSGWDNPFRPGGDLSREADEIVNMIRGGKPITPTEGHALGNGNIQKDSNSNTTAVETVTKTSVTQNQSAQNGTNRVQSTITSTTTTVTPSAVTKTNGENNGVTVSKQVVPGPTSASHVVIDEKKNKKKGCCVIQ